VEVLVVIEDPTLIGSAPQGDVSTAFEGNADSTNFMVESRSEVATMPLILLGGRSEEEALVLENLAFLEGHMHEFRPTHNKSSVVPQSDLPGTAAPGVLQY
jgi:hypothetical protein